MKVLVIGNGAREHLIVLKLVQSKAVSKVYCAPGNCEIEKIAECLDIRSTDIKSLLDFAEENNIDLTVANNEESISLGIANSFREKGRLIFAPTKEAARITYNRSSAKKFLYKQKVPTAKFHIFDKEGQALSYAKKADYPLVIKYDTRTSKENVFICDSFNQAKKVTERCFELSFKNIIFEEYKKGESFSFQVVTDGYNAVPLPSCRFYSWTLDGNGGYSVDGTGAYSPLSFIDEQLQSQMAQKVFYPILDGLNQNNNPYTGILSIEFIIDENKKFYVTDLRANVPDSAAVTSFSLLEDDLFRIFYSTATGALADEFETFSISNDSVIVLPLLSGISPDKFYEGNVIEGLEEIDDESVTLLFSNISKNDFAEIVTAGFKPITILARVSTLHRAREKAYETAETINFQNKSYRKDIAKISDFSACFSDM